MKVTVCTVNFDHHEINFGWDDAPVFESQDALQEWLDANHKGWTSLVATVSPACFNT